MVFYLWAIRKQGTTDWTEQTSSENQTKFISLLHNTIYEIKVKVFGDRGVVSSRPPRTEDFREVDAWRRSLGIEEILVSGPTIDSTQTGTEYHTSWLYAHCTQVSKASNWSSIVAITTPIRPIPSKVTGVAVTDEALYIDPTTGITLASVKVEWDNNADSELVDSYEVLWVG